jgi:hypothetical protein
MPEVPASLKGTLTAPLVTAASTSPPTPAKYLLFIKQENSGTQHQHQIIPPSWIRYYPDVAAHRSCATLFIFHFLMLSTPTTPMRHWLGAKTTTLIWPGLALM